VFVLIVIFLCFVISHFSYGD